MTRRTLVQSAVMIALLLSASTGTRAQAPNPRPAVPLDARTAIFDAFGLHRIVGLGDAHGNQLGEAFQLALVADSRFPAIVNDILVESGNSRYQDVLDRYVRGEDVPREALHMQRDVAEWPVPSLTHVRGTVLGHTNLADYFGPGGKDIPEQWRATMEDQFDAVLYLGPLSAITFATPRPWRCSEPAMAERLRRLRLQRPALADRVEKECVA